MTFDVGLVTVFLMVNQGNTLFVLISLNCLINHTIVFLVFFSVCYINCDIIYIVVGVVDTHICTHIALFGCIYQQC